MAFPGLVDLLERLKSEGIGLGYVVLHEPRVVVTNLLNEDTETELRRLSDALGNLRIEVVHGAR